MIPRRARAATAAVLAVGVPAGHASAPAAVSLPSPACRTAAAVAPVLLQRPGLLLSVAPSARVQEELSEEESPVEAKAVAPPVERVEVETVAAPVPQSAVARAGWEGGWQRLLQVRWHRWSPPSKLREHGVSEFLFSAHLFYWCLFGAAVAVAVLLRFTVLDQLAEAGSHALGLLVWLALGGVYNAIIWINLGQSNGINWLAGYLMELTFLVENVFVFSIVARAFRLPLRLTPKALACVVWAQVLFEMVFFMGLAVWLRTFRVLPYALGIWLICCGFSAACERNHAATEDFDVMDTAFVRTFRLCLGDRLLPSYDKEGDRIFIRDDRDGRHRVSLLGLAVFGFLLADFFLEIDVVLTKIEEFPNSYISFSSSALAAMAIPELFFVAHGLLRRFVLLKYGIAFILVFFGAQLLLCSVEGLMLPPLAACSLVVGVLGLSLLASGAQGCVRRCRAGAGSSPAEGAQGVAAEPGARGGVAEGAEEAA